MQMFTQQIQHSKCVVCCAGMLRNTAPLDYDTRHNYILEVKAEDCGGSESKMSDKLIITVTVKSKCKALWAGECLHIQCMTLTCVTNTPTLTSLSLCNHTNQITIYLLYDV